MPGYRTGCRNEQRHDKADKCTDNNIDVPYFKLNVLPNFGTNRIYGLNDDVFCSWTGAACHAIGMAPYFNVDQPIFINSHNGSFFYFHDDILLFLYHEVTCIPSLL